LPLQNLDLILSQTSIEEWLFQFAISPYIKDQINIQILSALYPKPHGLLKNLVNTFSTITWISILVSIITVALTLYSYAKFQSKELCFLFVIKLILLNILNRVFDA